jgi:two-component system cell cycle sensor histidine kinase/response regulator CckA
MSEPGRTREQLLEELDAARRRIAELEGSSARLEQRAAELEALFRAYPDLGFRLRSDGTIVEFQAGRASDLYTTPENFLGRRMQDVLPPEVTAQLDVACEQALGGSIAAIEYALTLPAGERTFEARAVKIFDDELYFVVRDVTDRKRAEEKRLDLEAQLQRSQKLESLGVLAGGIAHDFNNILTGLLGNTELALRQLPADSPIRSLLRDVRQAGGQAADLTNQMLAYSGKGRFVVEEIDVSGWLQGMSKLLENAASTQVTLSYELVPDLPAVRADVTQLAQIVLNLVSNASDAIGDEAGVVRVSTCLTDCDRAFLDTASPDEEFAEGRYLTIQISDTGRGMDAETRAKIFDPFFTTKFTGRGLGLAAVQGIVRGHKGVIVVESEPAQGTTFKVLLPTLAHAAKAVAARSEHEGSDDWQGSGTILFVDDRRMVRAATTRMLEHFGFSVLTASDGIEAVALFRERRDEIDCVLLDLNMPNMGGEESYDEIRKISSDVPVILSSGYGEQESAKRFGERGLAGFIQKPYKLSRLGETLRNALGETK